MNHSMRNINDFEIDKMSNIAGLHLATAVHIVLVDDVLDLLLIRIDPPVVLQLRCGTTH